MQFLKFKPWLAAAKRVPRVSPPTRLETSESKRDKLRRKKQKARLIVDRINIIHPSTEGESPYFVLVCLLSDLESLTEVPGLLGGIMPFISAHLIREAGALTIDPRRLVQSV